MKLLLATLIGCLTLGGLSPSPSSAQEERCPDTLPSRLQVGAQAQVLPGPPNNLRADPDVQSARIGQLPANTVVEVLDGPVCADGYAWWQVSAGASVGWTVEAVEQAYVLMPVRTVQAGGVSLVVDATVPDVVAEIVPASGGDIAGWYAYPEYVRFVFNAGDENARYRSWLTVFPIVTYGKLNPYRADEIHAFQKMLEERPPLQARQPLPFLTIGLGAAQVLTAEPDYLDFEHLHGLRYVAAYAQNIIPIRRDTLTYVFQGITTDGKYYVSFSLPLSVSTLPETVDTNAFYEQYGGEEGADYGAYLDSVISTLVTSEPEAFSPPLETLDAMMALLQIDPATLADVIQVGEQMAAVYDTRVAAWEYGSCGRSDLPSRLSIGDTARSTFQSPYLVGAYNMPGEEEAGWTIFPGDMVVVLDGPVCVQNQDYWLVYSDVSAVGSAGWVAEQGPFLEAEKDRYYLEPASDRVVPPDTLPGQTVTDCTITPLLYAYAVDEGSLLTGDYIGRLKNGVPYYADALLRRPEGGVLWWRLAPGATIYGLDEPLTPQGTLWVRAIQVSESNGCMEMPVIEHP
jgi:hypothetical protein